MFADAISALTKDLAVTCLDFQTWWLLKAVTNFTSGAVGVGMGAKDAYGAVQRSEEVLGEDGATTSGKVSMVLVVYRWNHGLLTTKSAGAVRQECC